MSLLRFLRGNPIARRVVAALGAVYIRFADATTRWRIEGAEYRDLFRNGETTFLVCLWHGRILALPPEKTRSFDCVAMISNNRDGDMIAATLVYFGIRAVRGSTRNPDKDKDKGGREAYGGALAELTGPKPVVVAITPDGPRGPRMRCQVGIAALSVQTGIPVIPVTFSVRRGPVLRSWDRFLLNWPFNSGVKIFGEPIDPPANRDAEAIETHRLRIEETMNALTRRADELCGRVPVAPADPAA